MARHLFHGRQNSRVFDTAGAEIALDHYPARRGI
jgi:hypothetical protein